MPSNINFGVNMQVKADTTSAKAEMKELSDQLRKLVSGVDIEVNTRDIDKMNTALKEGQEAAAALQLALNKATNARTGQLDLKVFSESLKSSGQNLDTLGKKMSSLGSSGVAAFTNIAQQVVKAEEPIRQTSKMMDSLFRTMSNSVKWQLSATALYGIMDAISGAYDYAVDLDTSLNNIRIVSGQSAQQMKEFAEYANQSAKALGTTTQAYADASLIYYQQGLAEQEVKDRTDLTIQMANVTGDTVQEVSDQLTAVWNNFYDGSHSLEYYIDVMTELGAATASSSSEIAEGLQDFSAIADMIGLSFDYAATAIATTTSVSRQSANVVGTSFRSIFSRMQGLMMGETLEDGVDLNKYSNALAKVGINVLDMEGNIRDMNSLMDEMGEKWSTLSKTQQTALAQTVAGVWQYNNLVTLFNNWDVFKQNLSYAQNSAGTLQEQSQIYEESWVAAANHVKAALEGVYNDILDSDIFKDILDGIATSIEGVDTFIEAVGGLPGTLAVIGASIHNIFGKQIASTLVNFQDLIYESTGINKQRYSEMRDTIINSAVDAMTGWDASKAGAETIEMSKTLKLNKEYYSIAEKITDEERELLSVLMEGNKAYAARYRAAADNMTKIANRLQTDSGNLNQLDISNFSQARQAAIKDARDIYNSLSDELDQVYPRLRVVNEQFSDSKDIESYVKRLKEVTEDIAWDSVDIGKIIDSADASTTVQDLMSSINKALDDGTNDIIKRYGLVRDNLVNALDFEGIKENQRKVLSEFIQDLDVMINKASVEYTESFKDFDTSTQNIFTHFKEAKGITLQAADGIAAFGQAVFNATTAVFTLRSAFETLSDPDASTFDKLLSTTMSLGVAIPAIIELFQALSVVRSIDFEAAAKQVVKNYEHLASTMALEKGIKKQTAAEAAGIVVSEAGNKTLLQKILLYTKLDKVIKVFNLSNLISGFKTLGGLLPLVATGLKALMATIATNIAPILIISGAIWGVTKAVEYLKIALRDDDAYELQQATEAAQNLQSAFQEAKAAQDQLTSDIDGYNNLRDNIDSLTEGTLEYKQAILEANNAATQLIENYSDIIGTDDWSVDDNGLINIDEDALQEVLEESTNELLQKSAASTMAARQQASLTTQNNINEEARKFADNNRGFYDDGSGYAFRRDLEDAYLKVVEAASEDRDILLSRDKFEETLGFSDALNDIFWDSENKIIPAIDEAVNAIKANTESQNQQADVISKQILEAEGMESNAFSGDVYDKAYQEAYDQATNDMEGRWRTLAKGAGLTDDQLRNAEYDSANQILRYKERDSETGEYTTIEIPDNELANLYAANKAQKELIKSTGLLSEQIGKLNNSTKETDQSIANFLQKGNLESLTYSQYEAVKDMSTADQKQALGLTGNKSKDDELAQAAGFDNAKQYLEAFQEALEVEWEYPKGLSDKIANDLTIGASHRINSNIKTMSKEAGEIYLSTLNGIIDSFYAAETPVKDIQTFVDSFSSINVAEGGIGTFVQEMAELGYEIDTSTDAWGQFVQVLYESQNYIPDLDELTENLAKIKEITEDLELGDLVSEKDYSELVKFNGALQEYFTILTDGSAQLTGDPLDLQQLIDETSTQELENNLNRLQQLQDTYEKASNINYYSQNYQDAAKSQGLQSWNEQQNFKGSFVQDQLDILRESDYNKQEINQWQERINQGKATQEVYNEVAKAVAEVSDQFSNAALKASEFEEQSQSIMNELALDMNAGEAKKAWQSGQINDIAYANSAQSRINEDKYENIEVEEVQEYSDYLQDAADSVEYLSDELRDNSEAAEDVALATLRMNKGAETLIDNWDTWGDVLKNSSKNSEEYAEAAQGVKGALSDLIQVSEDFISNDFIADHLNEIERAAMGDTAAIDSLRQAMAQDLIINATINNTGVREQAFGLLADVNNILASKDITIGATINDQDLIAKINEILRVTGMSVEEAQAMLNSLGFEPTFKAQEEWMHEWIPYYEYKIDFTGDTRIFDENGDLNPHFSYTVKPRKAGEIYKSWKTQVPAWSADGTPQVTSLTATGGGSSSGGFSGFNFAPSNSGGSSAWTPPSSGGGGGGSSGSDKKKEEEEVEEPEPAELMEYTKIEEVVDRYYEINNSIERMEDALNDAADAADRLYGKDRISAMERERDLMVQHRDLLQQQRQEIQAYLTSDKAALQNNEYGVNFQFNADGNITNWTTIQHQLFDELHAAEQKYNSFATKDEQEAFQESTLDPLNKKIEDLKALVEMYDSSLDAMIDVDNAIQDALNEWQDKNYEILTYKIELQIEINDMEQDRLDYYLNKYEDDFYKMAESMALTGDSFPLLTNNLATYKDEINKLTDAYNKGEISQDAFIEGMKDVNDGLLDNMNSLIDLDREMLEYYENTLGEAEDKLSDFTDQLEHQMAILEHYENVLSLINKEQDYQMIGSVLQGQFQVAQDQLAAQEKWVETLKNQKADIEEDLANAVGEEEQEALRNQLLLVTQSLNDAEEAVYGLRESVLELADAILENNLAENAKEFSEALGAGLGYNNLDDYLDALDRMNTEQEEYLTKTNQIYETDKLIRQAQVDMAENDSKLAQQKYKEYIDYIKQLQEQGKLSKYELEIAQARYEVLQAQIALEEAQNAKDSMRLVRDSQGNYNYVYTANQDNISNAEQALADAENNLYNIGLSGAQEYQEKYAQILQQAYEDFKQLTEDYRNGEIATLEEYNNKKTELQNHYYELLKTYGDLYYVGHDLLVEESYNNEADYLFAGIGNLEDFKEATDQYLQDCNNAFDEWEENTNVATDSVGEGLGDLQDHINNVTSASDDLTEQIQDSLIPTLEDELESVRDVTNLWLSHRDALYETLEAYEALQKGVQNTVSNAAGVQPGGVLPDIPPEYKADFAAIMSAYIKQGGSTKDSLFQQLLARRNEKVEWLAANGYSSSYWGTYGDETLKVYEALESGGGDREWMEYGANMYTQEQIRELLQQMGLPTFKKGGYTGEWGPEGRLAIIHEKELVLNSSDTEKLVDILRDYSGLSISTSTGFDKILSVLQNIITEFRTKVNTLSTRGAGSIAAQQVSIEATFPNVSVASEIEDAFNNLLNQAAQYSSLNRVK